MSYGYHLFVRKLLRRNRQNWMIIILTIQCQNHISPMTEIFIGSRCAGPCFPASKHNPNSLTIWTFITTVCTMHSRQLVKSCANRKPSHPWIPDTSQYNVLIDIRHCLAEISLSIYAPIPIWAPRLGAVRISSDVENGTIQNVDPRIPIRLLITL